MAVASPDALREAIAAQRTVPHSIAALLRAVCSQIYAAVDNDDMAPAEALADSIDANPAGWALAVTQNTPDAAAIAALELDEDRVSGVAHAFAPLGNRADAKAKADAERAERLAAKEAAEAQAVEDAEAETRLRADQDAREAAAAREAEAEKRP